MTEHIKYIPRSFRTHPGYTLATVLTLGICVGACFAVAGLYNRTFMQQLPLPDVDELVWVRSSMQSQRMNPDLARELCGSEEYFRKSGAYTQSWWQQLEVAPQQQASLGVALVTSNLFDVLRVKPHIGRLFNERDGFDGAEQVMVLSYEAWMRHFSGDPSVIDKIYQLSSHPTRVVGVLPEGFDGPSTTETISSYLPVVNYRSILDEDFLTNLNWHSMSVVARVHAETRLKTLEEQLQAFFLHYVEARPEKFAIEPRVFDMKSDTLHRRSDLARLYHLFGGVCMALLLIAVCNALALIVLRCSWRTREILVRLAVGADYGQILRLFAVETLFLITLTALIAAGTSWAMIYGLVTLFPDLLSRGGGNFVGPALLYTAVGVFLFMFLLFTLAPLIWACRLRLGEVIQGGRGVSRRFRLLPVLAVTQVAVTAILIVFSFLFVRSAHEVATFDPGFSYDNQVVYSYNMSHLNLEGDGYAAVRRSVNEAVEVLPEVVQVADGRGNYLYQTGTSNFLREGQRLLKGEGEQDLAHITSAGPGFLRLMKIPLLNGRGFEPEDAHQEEQLVMINHAFAARYFPGEDPLDQRIRLSTEDAPLRRIVGVVADFYVTVEENRFPHIITQFNLKAHYGTATAETRGSDGIAKQAIEKMLNDEFSHLGAFYVNTGKEMLLYSTGRIRSAAILVSSVAVLAVVLSLVGLYIVFAFSAVLSRRDYAIRTAMGATPSQTVRLAFSSFGRICLIGLLAGLAVAFFLVPFAGDSLMRIHPRDPVVFILAALLIAFTGSCISLLTACHTLRMDPARELQE